MCNSATKPDCYRHRVLGLPRGKLDAVSRIRRGAAVFLYDFDAKCLYGPYCADSDGGLGLVPGAFHGRFPAQVKFRINGDFMPLPEKSLRSAIKENYVNGKFSPELSSTQVEKLRSLFQPITLLPESSSPPHDVDNWPPAHAPAPLPPSTHLEQPLAYARHPTAYVAPQAAHSLPPEAYPPQCPYLPPAQPTTNVVTMTGYGNLDGYEAQSLASAYRYVQAPCSLYAQSSMSAHVSGPASSTAPYYTAYHKHPYQLGSVNFHYQQSTCERATHGTGHGIATRNMQLVRDYGSFPSGPSAVPVRDWGLMNQPQ